MSLPEDPREAWVLRSAEVDERRTAKHELVLEVKRLVEASALMRIKPMEPERIRELASACRELADRMEAEPSWRERGGLAMAPGSDSVLQERSGITGRSNALAPPLSLEFEGNLTKGSAVWTAAYEGPPGCLHGGFVAAAFDDLLGCAQMASGTAGFTGTLTIRMRKPIPHNERIDYDAAVDRIEGRKLIVKGKALLGDEVLAEAEGLFITPKGGVPIPPDEEPG